MELYTRLVFCRALHVVQVVVLFGLWTYFQVIYTSLYSAFEMHE